MHGQPSGCPTCAAQRLRWENTTPNPPDALKPDAGEPTAAARKLQIPKMDGFATMKCAIACVAPGVMRTVREARHDSQLIYAEQVASSLHNRKEKKSEPPPPPDTAS